jgi:hypothetical protein
MLRCRVVMASLLLAPSLFFACSATPPAEEAARPVAETPLHR